jgi:hypothetical protein
MKMWARCNLYRVELETRANRDSIAIYATRSLKIVKASWITSTVEDVSIKDRRRQV